MNEVPTDDTLTDAPLTDDRLLGGRVVLRQPASGYRAAIDPVLLAAAVPARPGDQVLDAGAGVGTAALCLAVRVTDAAVVGVEADAGLVRLAEANAAATGVADRVRFVAADILDPPSSLAPGTFHQVMANPPYQAAHTGRASPHPERAAATVEGAAALADWVAFCIRMARPKGRVTLIHRADRLGDLLGGDDRHPTQCVGRYRRGAAVAGRRQARRSGSGDRTAG